MFRSLVHCLMLMILQESKSSTFQSPSSVPHRPTASSAEPAASGTPKAVSYSAPSFQITASYASYLARLHGSYLSETPAPAAVAEQRPAPMAEPPAPMVPPPAPMAAPPAPMAAPPAPMAEPAVVTVTVPPVIEAAPPALLTVSEVQDQDAAMNGRWVYYRGRSYDDETFAGASYRSPVLARSVDAYVRPQRFAEVAPAESYVAPAARPYYDPAANAYARSPQYAESIRVSYDEPVRYAEPHAVWYGAPQPVDSHVDSRHQRAAVDASYRADLSALPASPATHPVPVTAAPAHYWTAPVAAMRQSQVNQTPRYAPLQPPTAHDNGLALYYQLPSDLQYSVAHRQ